MAIINSAHASRLTLLKQGFYSGLGWAAGVTVGFALVSTIIVLVLNRLGGLPVIGGFFADIVAATTSQLSGRSVLSPTHKISTTPTPTVFVYPVDTQE